MHLLRHLPILFAVLLFSCTEDEKNTQLPEDVLSKAEMVEVMVDVQLLEATFNQRLLREDDPMVKMAVYYNQIFEKHGVEREKFVNSHRYWTARPEEMLEIYHEVINRLTRLEEEINKDQL